MAHAYDREALADAKRRLIELDFSEENERLAEIERKIQETSRAQGDAQRRIAEINAFNASDAKAEISRLADALIAGAEAPSIANDAGSQDKRAAEKEALISARQELGMRIGALHAQKGEVEKEARTKLAVAAQPLAELVLNRARASANDLLEAFAELKALSQQTGRYRNEVDAMSEGLHSLRQDYGILSRKGSTVEIPRQMIEALAPLQDAGPVLSAGRHSPPQTVDI